MLRLELVVTGPDLVVADLEGLGARARDAKPAMQSLLAQMVRAEAKQFETEGLRAGEKWKPDKPSTIASKRRRHLDLRTERATGELEASLTTLKRGTDRVRRASKLQTTFGTRIYYARVQTRTLLDFTQEDQDGWERTLVGWLMDGVT